MAEVPNTPTPDNIEQIALQIKSLEQRTTSVTLPRTASVLELKQEIQLAFDVDSERQRLIFQGRVLKDDKHLTDYANLDNGKVVHLVIRPVDAPHNPLNDEPNASSRNRPFSSRSRILPSISSRFPMMEGYAFITLDSNIGEFGGHRSLLPSMISGLSSTLRNTETPSINSTGTRQRSTRPDTDSRSSRSTTNFTFGRTTDNTNRTSLPFPPSVEVRLARTLGSIRNVRYILEEQSNVSQASVLAHSTPDQLQEIRNRLRSSGNNQSSQIAMVIRELTEVMQLSIPRMREVSSLLREETRPIAEETNDRNRVINLSRIIQGMSLINHFLGSVLASADIENMRRATPTSPLTTPIMTSNHARYLRETTETVRPTSPPPPPAPAPNKKSPLSTSSSASEPSTSKRKNPEEEDSSTKKPRNEKGKDKHT